MKRKLKFRFYSAGQWYYSDYYQCHSFIFAAASVMKGEINQWIGMKDKTGRDIYEGDITEIPTVNNIINRHIVKFGTAERQMGNGYNVEIPCFYFEETAPDHAKRFPIVVNDNGVHDLTMLVVVGNIYENKDLINEN